jgi:hypothetical protein
MNLCFSEKVENLYNFKIILCQIFLKDIFVHNSYNELKTQIKSNSHRLLCLWPQSKYKAKYKYLLNNHIFIHSEEIKYKCNQNECNKRF